MFDTVIDLFKNQVKDRPNQNSLVEENKTLTYRELDEKSEIIANVLINNGVSSLHKIGLSITNSIETIISIIGILKVGAAYVPIDPTLPLLRKEKIIKDCEINIIIKENEQYLFHNLLEFNIHNLLSGEQRKYKEIISEYSYKNQKDNLAYILYTSGSTGTPKGVMIKNESIINLVKNINQEILKRYKGPLNIALVSPYYFDGSVKQIFSSLLFGHVLHIIPENKRFDGYELKNFYVKHKIQISDGTPIHVKLLNEVKEEFVDCSLQHLLIGGEELEVHDVKKLLKKINSLNITNVYGPTECCVDTTMFHIPKDQINQLESIPLGKPLSNVNVFLLKENKKVLEGTVGEICISGLNLAKGYVNAKENEGKFIYNKLIHNERFYKTGDLGVINKYGELLYVGRLDNQVKINGNRIELNEIKELILELENVEDVIVSIYNYKQYKNVCAYYKTNNNIKPIEITEYLKKRLPKYMIPAFVYKIEEIPLTKNGKIDYKTLPSPNDKLNLGVFTEKNTIHLKLVSIFQEVLGSNNEQTFNFFDLGGNSISAMKIINYIYEKFKCKLKVIDIFENPDLEDLSRLIKDKQAAEKKDHTFTNTNDKLYLLKSQVSFLNSQLVDKDNLSNNVSLIIKFNEVLNYNKLIYTIEKIINRHNILRAYIADIQTKEVRYSNSTGIVIEDIPNQENMNNIISGFIKPFEMNGTLFRMGISKLTNKEWLFIWDFHHLLVDGISLNILYDEFVSIYFKESKLESITYNFRDYVIESQTTNKEIAKKYWLNLYKNNKISLIELPYDYKRKNYKSNKGSFLEFDLDEKFNSSISEISKKTKSSKSIVLYSVLIILLHKYSRQKNIQIGYTFSGRNSQKFAKSIGMFTKVLPIMNNINPEETIYELIQKVKFSILNAIDNSEYLYEELIEDLDYITEPNRNPLFDVSFTYNEIIENNDDKRERINFKSQTSKNDLALEINSTNLNTKVLIRYDTSLFKYSSIENLKMSFLLILNELLTNPNELVVNIDFSKNYHRNKLSTSLSEIMNHKTIISVFMDLIDRNPDKTALEYGDKKCSYYSLNLYSNSLANHLNNIGVKKGEKIAILMEHSEMTIVSIMAVLKLGCIYVPIDPDYPEERVNYIVKDSSCSMILSDSGNMENIGNEPVININNFDLTQNQSYQYIKQDGNDLAYIIYTSGSTGVPKGVMVTHNNVISLVVGNQKIFNIEKNDKWLLFHSLCFDFSVWELFGALLNYSKIIILSRMDIKDPHTVVKTIKNKGISILNQTPTAFNNISQVIMDEGTNNNLKKIIFGGESLNYSKLKDFKLMFPEVNLINMYGITETTVHVTFKNIGLEDIKLEVNNIGKPLETATIILLDENKKLVPKGSIGEIYIGGTGVSRGYCNREELNKEVFIKNPFDDNEILYKSGDLARELSNGEYEYIGRIDNQIKVNGYRIEKEEIEKKIYSLSNIKECRIEVINEESKKNMYAFLIGINSEDGRELAKKLRTHLPSYMIPHQFYICREFPMNNNGKMDINQAMMISQKISDISGDVFPRTDLEKEISEIWSKVLDVGIIDIYQNYFFIGGDSIKAVETISRINQRFNIRLEVKDIYIYPSISELSTLVENSCVDWNSNSKFSLESELLPDNLIEKVYEIEDAGNIEDIMPISDIQYGMLYYSIKYPKESYYHDQMLYEISDEDLDIKIFKQAIQELVKKHEILRTNFILEKYMRPIQIIKKYKAEDIDVTCINYNNYKNTVENELEIDRVNLFDFENDFLWRVKILEKEKGKNILFLTAHHAILDGWSVASFITELNDIYKSIKEGAFIASKLINSYKDYISQELIYKEKKYIAEYWKSELGFFEKENILPANRNLEKIDKKTVIKEIDSLLFSEINKVAMRNNCSTKVIYLSAFIALANMYSKNQDILVGVVDHNRPIVEDSSKILGCFLNTIPTRVKMLKNYTWRDLINAVKEKIIENKKNSTTLNHIFNLCNINHLDTISPLFDMLFNFVDFHVYKTSNDLMIRPINGGFSRTNSKFSLTVSLTLDEVKIKVVSDFEEVFTDKMIEYYITIIEEMVKNENDNIDKSRIHKERVNECGTEYLEFTEFSILNEIKKNVYRTPSFPAVKQDEMILTYKELDERSNIVASFFKSKGFSKGDVIALDVCKNIQTIINIIAVFKVGAIYLPINQEVPSLRKKYILEDSGAKALITDGESNHFNLDIELITCREILDYKDSSSSSIVIEKVGEKREDIKYILYTSGTTGNPKGFRINNEQMIHYFKYCIFSRIERGLNTVLSSSFMFDASVKEIFGSFLYGHTLNIIPEKSIFEPDSLVNFFIENNINIFVCTPSHLKLINMVKQYKGLSLKYLILGGEALFKETIIEFTKKFIRDNGYIPEFVNNYGPSETCIDVSNYTVQNKDLFLEKNDSISFGKPFGNTSLFILDSNNQLQPTGVPGYIFIGGPAVFRGYLYEQDNNNSYIENQFSNSRLLYKTGDLGIKDEMGNYYFISRDDSQVKINGYRIEISEIEYCIKQNRYVKDAFVCIKSNNQQDYICAYIIWRKSDYKNILIQELKSILHSYMIPNFFISVNEWPLNRNGKLDSNGLPTPFINGNIDFTINEELNKTQIRLTSIWKEVLSINSIRLNDNFFEIGGRSITSVELVYKVRSEFNIELKMQDLFENPTLLRMSEIVDKYLEKKFESKNQIKKLLSDSVDENLLAKEILERNIRLSKSLYGMVDESIIDIGCVMGEISAKSEQKGILGLYKVEFDFEKVNAISNLNSFIERLINHHDIFRIMPYKIDDTFKYRIKESKIKLEYSFLVDISIYGKEIKSKIIEETINNFKQNLHSRSYVGNILYNFIIFKIDRSKFKFLMISDHQIADVNSSFILKQNFVNGVLEKESLSFSDYIKHILCKDNKKKYNLLIETPLYKKYVESSLKLNEKYSRRVLTQPLIISSPIKLSLEINEELMKEYHYNTLGVFLKIVVSFLMDEFKINELPIRIQYNWRHFRNKDYTNTLGNFSDGLPCTFIKNTNRYIDQYNEVLSMVTSKLIRFRELNDNLKVSRNFYHLSPLSINFLGDITSDSMEAKDFSKKFPYPIIGYTVDASKLFIILSNGISERTIKNMIRDLKKYNIAVNINIQQIQDV